MWRPRLKSVIAVALLWQLAAGLLLAVPAMASAHTGIAPSAAEAHCHANAATGSAQSSATPGSAAHHANAADCCQGLHACHCACAQGTLVMPQVTTTTTVTDHSARAGVRSPPLVQRTAELFRPPI